MHRHATTTTHIATLALVVAALLVAAGAVTAATGTVPPAATIYESLDKSTAAQELHARTSGDVHGPWRSALADSGAQSARVYRVAVQLGTGHRVRTGPRAVPLSAIRAALEEATTDAGHDHNAAAATMASSTVDDVLTVYEGLAYVEWSLASGREGMGKTIVRRAPSVASAVRPQLDYRRADPTKPLAQQPGAGAGQPQEQTFWQKYWLYIVLGVLTLSLGGGAKDEGAAEAGGRAAGGAPAAVAGGRK